MKTQMALCTVFGFVLLSGPAFAQEADEEQVAIEVIEQDDDGRATRIIIDGREYAVCTPELQDNCVNPREVGLDQGNRALDHWPGRPASATDEALPQDESVAVEADESDETPVYDEVSEGEEASEVDEVPDFDEEPVSEESEASEYVESEDSYYDSEDDEEEFDAGE